MTERAGVRRNFDVAIIGDGPAGSALARAAHARGIDAVLVGPDDPWTATYGTWADDVETIGLLGGVDVWRHRLASIAVDVGGYRVIDRPYGVIDNSRLRRLLRRSVRHVRASVRGVVLGDADFGRRDVVQLYDGGHIVARVVVDAAGRSARFHGGDGDASSRRDAAFQTAFGVVLPTPPDGPLGRAMLMDFSRPDGPRSDEHRNDRLDVPSFGYALPVDDGWLVEETVLAARPAVDPDRLRHRLAGRLGRSVAALTADAVRIERVAIPMGGPVPDRTRPILGFGAAAAMIHPATGYSVASSLAAADRVASAIEDQLTHSTIDHRQLWQSVWSTAALRTRLLHDYGLAVLLDLDEHGVRTFFSTFFDLPTKQWAAYLRIDTPPRELVGIMASVFTAAPWRLRRSLVSRNPLAFGRLIRP